MWDMPRSCCAGDVYKRSELDEISLLAAIFFCFRCACRRLRLSVFFAGCVVANIIIQSVRKRDLGVRGALETFCATMHYCDGCPASPAGMLLVLTKYEPAFISRLYCGVLEGIRMGWWRMAVDGAEKRVWSYCCCGVVEAAAWVSNAGYNSGDNALVIDLIRALKTEMKGGAGMENRDRPGPKLDARRKRPKRGCGWKVTDVTASSLHRPSSAEFTSKKKKGTTPQPRNHYRINTKRRACAPRGRENVPYVGRSFFPWPVFL